MSGLLLNFYRGLAKAGYPLVSMFAGLIGEEEDRQLFNARLGKGLDVVKANAPYDIWLHAVSVGEVMVAEALVRELLSLRSGLKILLSSFTVSGQRQARRLLQGLCDIAPGPFDFPQAAQGMLSVCRPKVYACVETELWPNMFIDACKAGVKTAIVNARLSLRSFENYRRLKGLFSPVLENVELIMAISEADAGRFARLGARLTCLTVTGNAKYASLLSRIDELRQDVEKLRQKLGFEEKTKFFIAGSLRGGEEETVIRAWLDVKAKQPDLRLIIAPRHLERVRDVVDALKRHCVAFSLWSNISSHHKLAVSGQCIVVDSIGVLLLLYGLADVAFVGGSLVPKGGQNMMEPAVWSIPVLFGPFTDNFLDASQMLLENQGGFLVHNANELAVQLKRLCWNRTELEKAGKNAYTSLEMLSKNAVSRQAMGLLELFDR